MRESTRSQPPKGLDRVWRRVMRLGEPGRRWRGLVELREMLEAVPGGLDFAVRDFALITIAHNLSNTFAGQLVFKGGFVLRHVHGHMRFSKDVDATRVGDTSDARAASVLDADTLASAIRKAGIRNVVQFSPGSATSHSLHSLDFAHVRVTGELLPPCAVQVEISLREAVVGVPERTNIGAPYYEPFEILAMQPAEMCAEKIRALAQRLRATDLADLAVMLRDHRLEDETIAYFAEAKFRLVRRGRSNRIDRIERNILELADSYDDVVRQLFPNAPSYLEATDIVWPRLRTIVA